MRCELYGRLTAIPSGGRRLAQRIEFANSKTAKEREVLMIIADISGYTRFMVANQTALAHSQQIIGALLGSILEQVQIPLTVAKLEGDAVFLYAMKDNDDVLARVRETLVRLFDAFSRTLRQLATGRPCSCEACRNIDQLRLKVIAHSGRAVFYPMANGVELAGVDVIIVHRLLKNSIAAREYILLSDAAQRDLPMNLAPITATIEEYEEIGPVHVTAYAPGALAA
jgi:hypothetical protein